MAAEIGRLGAVPGPGEVTRLLRAWREGDESARERLIETVYEELRKIAGAHMRREKRSQTIEVTGLVNEAFLRLADQKRVDWRDRVHFFGLASNCMRRILIDRARARAAEKRTPGEHQYFEAPAAETSPEQLLDLDVALNALAAQYPRHARVVEMRYFVDLEMAEIGEVLGVSERTVKRDWAFARAWLLDALVGRT